MKAKDVHRFDISPEVASWFPDEDFGGGPTCADCFLMFRSIDDEIGHLEAGTVGRECIKKLTEPIS